MDCLNPAVLMSDILILRSSKRLDLFVSWPLQDQPVGLLNVTCIRDIVQFLANHSRDYAGSAS